MGELHLHLHHRTSSIAFGFGLGFWAASYDLIASIVSAVLCGHMYPCSTCLHFAAEGGVLWQAALLIGAQ